MKRTITLSTSTFLLFYVPGLIWLLALPVSAQQNDRLSQARQWSYQGRYLEADSLFQRMLQDEPDNIEARLGSAYNHSWHQHLNQARIEFEHVLKEHPQEERALLGLGYTLAWKKDYSNAKHPFLKVLSAHPGDIEARKGLAYVYLWQGASAVAIDMFESLVEHEPSNPEFYVALSHAHVQQYHSAEARRLVDHALGIDPSNSAALDMRAALASATPFLEIDVWGGYTSIEGASRIGIRGLQLSTQVNRMVRAMMSYDNTMSMDNIFFLHQRRQAETILGGALITWNQQHASRLQAGWRSLEDLGNQGLIMGEHIMTLDDRKILKLGGLLSQGRQTGEEWMMYGGMNIPLHKTFRLEPMYYLSYQGTGRHLQHRLVLGAQWAHRTGLEIGAGVHYGKVPLQTESKQEDMYGAYLSTWIPLIRSLWLGMHARQEKMITGTYQMAGLGLKWRIEK